jgi:RNA polymerase sigma-70 factor (ECF subfamily)
MVYSMVLGVLRDHAAAEEVLRDLFVQLWHSAAGFETSAGSLPAWLMVIGRHRALARLRQPLAQGRCEELKTYPAQAISSPFELEQETQARALMAALRAGMEELPRQDRETLELAYLEGLSETELARRTGESGDFVRTRLLSAMNVLIETYDRTRQG